MSVSAVLDELARTVLVTMTPSHVVSRPVQHGADGHHVLTTTHNNMCQSSEHSAASTSVAAIPAASGAPVPPATTPASSLARAATCGSGEAINTSRRLKMRL
jgi:hypothetical protein